MASSSNNIKVITIPNSNTQTTKKNYKPRIRPKKNKYILNTPVPVKIENDSDIRMHNVKALSISTSEKPAAVYSTVSWESYKNEPPYCVQPMSRSDEFLPYWNEISFPTPGVIHRKIIVAELMRLCRDYDFCPVGYKSTSAVDSFLIRLTKPCLDFLIIKNGLQFTMANSTVLNLTIRLNVGNFILGQVNQQHLVPIAIERSYKPNQIVRNRFGNLLNYAHFGTRFFAKDIAMGLCYTKRLDQLCSELVKYQKNRFAKDGFHINGLMLSSNNLHRLGPLNLLSKINIEYLDLRNNDIANLDDLKPLQRLPLKVLLLDGNPVEKLPEFLQGIFSMFPNIILDISSPVMYYSDTEPNEIVTNNAPITSEVVSFMCDPLPQLLQPIDMDICVSDEEAVEELTTVTIAKNDVPIVVENVDLTCNRVKKIYPVPVVANIDLTEEDDSAIIIQPEKTVMPTKVQAPSPPVITKEIKNSTETVQPMVPPRAAGIPKRIRQSGIPTTWFDTNLLFAVNIETNKWHRITLTHNGKATKFELLDVVFALVPNYKLLPAYYISSTTYDQFMVRDCLDALNVLIKQKPMVMVGDHQIGLDVHLNARDVNESDRQTNFGREMNELLKNRCTQNPLKLSLDDWSSATEWKSFSSCLTHIITLEFVTRCVVSTYPNLTVLTLARNRLTTVKGLHRLTNMTQLTTLDLSENRLDDFMKFITECPAISSLTTLNLCGNLLCSSVTNSRFYVEQLMKLFPKLETLDGVPVKKNSPIHWNRNYLCNLMWYDFVECFVKKYFSVYDSSSRFDIREFYHPNAIFSMTFMFDSSKVTIANSRQIQRHSLHARNILKITNLDQSSVNLFVGVDKITHFLFNLPSTQHDFYTFSIDVTTATESMICISINGLFKEMGVSNMEQELWLGFVRTFVIKPYSSELGIFEGTTNYRICNEQMNLFGLTEQQIRCGFLSSNNIVNTASGVLLQNDRQNIIQIFQHLTNMKPSWSTKCLENSNWILPDALAIFVKLHKNNKIPDQAFIKT